MTEIYNFSAGPAVMPKSVVKKIQAELPSYKGSGMSIMEISHRSSLYVDMQNEAESDLRQLMNVPDDYDVLFLQGGGTLQFDTIPLNLARKEKTVAVVDSGHWAVRARQEADLLPGISTYAAASGEAENYTKLPYSLNLDKPCDYVHVTLNNTIEGTMYRKLPDVKGNVVVADMSSNILAQRYNVEDFGLIMAGAQKFLHGICIL